MIIKNIHILAFRATPTAPTPEPYCPTLRISVYVLVLGGYNPTVPTLIPLPTKPTAH